MLIEKFPSFLKTQLEMSEIAEAMTHGGKVTALEMEWLKDYDSHVSPRLAIELVKQEKSGG